MKRAKYISNGTITYKIVGDQGPQGPKGDTGKSAYQIAVDNGFNGTESEWLETLKVDLSNIFSLIGYLIKLTVGETASTNVKVVPPIPIGTEIVSIDGATQLNGREVATTIDKQYLRVGTVTDRTINYINFSGNDVKSGDIVIIKTKSQFADNDIFNNELLLIDDISGADLVLNGYIRADGSFAPHTSWKTWCYFKKPMWSIVKSHTTANSPVTAIACYSNNEIGTSSLISNVTFSPDLEKNHEIHIPNNCKMVAVSSRTFGDEIINIYSLDANLKKIIDFINQEESYDSVGRAEFKLSNIDCGSDMTWVGNKLVVFDAQAGNTQDFNEESESTIRIYEFGDNIKDGYTHMYTLKHKFGHCNTVDYNPYNDSLIFGNGSGSYTLLGEIIIIPNFSSIVNVTESSDVVLTLQSVNALVIDCHNYNFGAKFNVLWGDDDDGRYNIAYLITAKQGGNINDKFGGDIGRIRKLVFCKYDDIGNYGVKQTKSNTSMNGTFNIVEEYTQRTNGYENCIQGACYYNGEIYACIGHDGMWYWRMRLDNGRIKRKNYKQVSYYNNIGGVSPRSASGMCIKDGFMFIGQVGIHAFRI